MPTVQVGEIAVYYELHGDGPPLVLIGGLSDRSTPLVAAQLTHAGIPGSQFSVFRGGHMFFLLSQRTAVIDRIENFLTA